MGLRSERLIRHHFNPELQINFQQGVPTRPGTLAWPFHHHRAYQHPNGQTDQHRQNRTSRGTGYCFTSLILINGDHHLLLREERILNSTYGIRYYSTLAAIWKRSQDNNSAPNLIINKSDSAVRALENLANKDNIVIKLRELIVRQRIRIFLADSEQINKIMNQTTNKTMKRAEQKWVKYRWPQLALQKQRYLRTRATNILIEQRLSSQLTTTMRKLCSGGAKHWAQIPLDKLTTQNLLMLTGMVTNGNRSLVRGELRDQETMYPGCGCARLANGTSSTLVHRLTECQVWKTATATKIPIGQETLTIVNNILLGKDRSLSKLDLIRQLTNLVIH